MAAVRASDRALACGVFEGEGSVHITPTTKRNCCTLEVCVTNTDLEILSFFVERWGGGIRERRMDGNRKRAYRWRVAARKAGRFLRDVQPFAISTRMKKRIALALKFQTGKGVGRPKNRRLYLVAQMAARDQMRELNRRGAA